MDSGGMSFPNLVHFLVDGIDRFKASRFHLLQFKPKGGEVSRSRSRTDVPQIRKKREKQKDSLTTAMLWSEGEVSEWGFPF